MRFFVESMLYSRMFPDLCADRADAPTVPWSAKVEFAPRVDVILSSIILVSASAAANLPQDQAMSSHVLLNSNRG